MTAEEIGHDRLISGQDIAAVAGFGAPRPPALSADCPFVTVDMPHLRPGPCYEVWAGDAPAEWSQGEGIGLARMGTSLFGILAVDPGDDSDFEAFGRKAYEMIFRQADRAGCPHVLRAFNYLPRITGQERGTERYRRFNAGRHEAFVAANRSPHAAPAASALGTMGGLPVVYFLSSTAAGQPIENPRQTSAYRYPPRYGTQSPSFSRAMLSGTDLFVSGTASIVGHESLHAGDAAAQADEILRNLDAILQRNGGRLRDAARSALVKIYVRHAADVDAIMDRVSPIGFGGVMVLRGEVCRDELLVEIEMFSKQGLLF